MSLFSRFFGKQPPKEGEGDQTAEGAQNAPDAPANPLAATVPQQVHPGMPQPMQPVVPQHSPHVALPQPGPAIPYQPPQTHQRTERMIPVDQRPPPPQPAPLPGSLGPAIPARLTPGQFPVMQGVVPPVRPQLESESGIALHIPEPAVELGSSAPPPSSVDPRFAHWGGRDPNAEIAETVPPVLRYTADGAAVAVAAPPDASDLTPTPAVGTVSKPAPAAAPAAVPSPAPAPVAAAAPVPKAPGSAPNAAAASKKPKRRDSPTNFHQVVPKPPPAPQAPHPGLRPNDALPTIIVDIPPSLPPPATGAAPSQEAAPVQRTTLKIPGAISTTPKPAAAAPSPAPPPAPPVAAPDPSPAPTPASPAVPAPAPSRPAAKSIPPQRMMSDTRPDPDSQAIMRAAVAYRESKAAVAAAAATAAKSTQPLPTTTSTPTTTPTTTSTPTPAATAPAPVPPAPPSAPAAVPPAPPSAPASSPAATRPMMRQKAPTLLGGMAAPVTTIEPTPPPPVSAPPARTASVIPRYPSAPPPPPPPIASSRVPVLDQDDEADDAGRTEAKTEVNLQDFVPAALAQVAAAAQSMKARASVAPQPPDESDWPTASELPDPDEWSQPVVPPPSSFESKRTSARPPLDSVDEDDAVTEARISRRPAPSAPEPTSDPSPMTTRSAPPPVPIEGGELEVISSGPATVPPSAPPPAPHGPEPKLWDGVGMDDVFNELDRGFGELGGVQSNRPADSFVFDDARQLFTEIAATHMHHVRDFMLDLTAAPTTAEWLALCIPATQSLRMGSVAFEMGTLTVALDAFMDALKATNDAGVPIVEGEYRDRLIAAYADLVKELPSAFKLDGEGRVREGIIVRALLNQLEDVRKVQQDRLFMAGLMSLDALCVAKPRDIVETTGLSLDLATRISERFRRYRLEISVLSHGNIRGEWDKLREYVAELTKAHAAFELASEKNDSKKKKESRRARELTILDVKVMLARLGKPESLNFIERAPFAEKISHLVALIEQSER